MRTNGNEDAIVIGLARLKAIDNHRFIKAAISHRLDEKPRIFWAVQNGLCTREDVLVGRVGHTIGNIVEILIRHGEGSVVKTCLDRSTSKGDVGGFLGLIGKLYG